MTTPVISVIDAFVGGCSLLENVEEVPPNSNTGPIVGLIQASTGSKPGDPWCASDMSYVGSKMFAARWPLPHTASCNDLALYAIQHGVFACVARVYDDIQAHGLYGVNGHRVVEPNTLGTRAAVVLPPERGDLCLLYNMSAHHFHHAGCVRDVIAQGTAWRSWEGNTTKPGQKGDQREGWGHFGKQHEMTEPWGWVRWATLLERSETP